MCSVDLFVTVLQTGCSALYRASTSNKPAMARLLIEAGADVNLATADGRTPLGVACWYGYAEVVRVLLEAGADVDTSNLVRPLSIYVCILTCLTCFTLILYLEWKHSTARGAGERALCCDRAAAGAGPRRPHPP